MTRKQRKQQERHGLICLRVGLFSPFDDNKRAGCSRCGHAVIHRPHAPVRNAEIICNVCFMEAFESGELAQTTLAVTPATVQELVALGIFSFRKGKR